MASGGSKRAAHLVTTINRWLDSGRKTTKKRLVNFQNTNTGEIWKGKLLESSLPLIAVSLPDEVFFVIFLFLELPEFLSLSKVNESRCFSAMSPADVIRLSSDIAQALRSFMFVDSVE